MLEVIDYTPEVNSMRDLFFLNAAKHCTPQEMEYIKKAYDIAFKAHSVQKRKSGEPYIIHPISVARIVSEEMSLGASPIIAALLHDVVEDTELTNDFIKENFGDDVAFLVKAVTKEKKCKYEMSQQLDNFKQMLDSINYDIRALLIKLADRLHNMRTLESMRADKQMKIACETDYFYAPLANRLSLYDVKSELENLSLKYRSPQEYARIEKKIKSYMASSESHIATFLSPIKSVFEKSDIKARMIPKVRSVYALWRKMQISGVTFKQLEHLFIINVIYEDNINSHRSEKNQALDIYSIITDLYKERPSSLVNYIDSPKENGYQGLHCQVMGDNGNWIELHISSERMAQNACLGCITDRDSGVENWVEKFKSVLKDIAGSGKDSGYLENIVSTLYNDDIVVFTPQGKNILLPKGASAIDFAYEIHTNVGNTAKACRVNGRLLPMQTVLKRGDRVEIITSDDSRPKSEWMAYVKSYKARKCLNNALKKIKYEKPEYPYKYCPICQPLPGDEVIGFKISDNDIMVHKRNCIRAISLSAQAGESIVNVIMAASPNTTYLSRINIAAVDRDGLLHDLVEIISKLLKLSIVSLNTETKDEIVHCSVCFLVHTADELRAIISQLENVDGVEEVKRIDV
ncbi:MAG: HD domain-containing protein [Bacteroidales bacterium]|nr:HD domain-containing protein [Bacteroidales bacterium]